MNVSVFSTYSYIMLEIYAPDAVSTVIIPNKNPNDDIVGGEFYYIVSSQSVVDSYLAQLFV